MTADMLRRRTMARAAGQPVPQPEPACAFPKTLAAAMAREGSVWNLGDALIEEVGPPGRNHIKTGSYAKVEAARQFLATQGIVYAFTHLIKHRDTAHAFPPDLRRYTFTIHIEACNPATLDAIVAALPEGETLTAAYTRKARRRLRANGDEPAQTTADTTIAPLMAPLIAAMRLFTKPMRIATIIKLAKAVGIELRDLAGGAPACQLEAARRLLPAPASPAPAVARIAAVA